MESLAIVKCFRWVLLLAFLYSTFSVNISWQALTTLVALLVSIYCLPFHPPALFKSPVPVTLAEEEKELKTKEILKQLYPKLSKEEKELKVLRAIEQLVTYSPEDTTSLQSFEALKQNSQCIFARNAKLWGSPDWNPNLSLEENVYRTVPTFLKFVILCPYQRLDGFLYELPGEEYGQDIRKFADGFRRVLQILSDNDPSGFHCMDKTIVGRKGWVFEFNKCTFFITSFAPFYPETSARYSFGCKHCYILFQPELSFAFHDLPPDTTHTNWENPVTVRDKIRAGFRNAGREYDIPETIYYPMSHYMVRPLKDSDPVIRWWETISNKKID